MGDCLEYLSPASSHPPFLSPWVFPILSETARWLGGHMTPAVWSWGRLFFPSNQINKDSSVLHAPLPLVSPSPRPCHEVTGSRCQEAGWPLLGLAACWSQPAWPCLFPASSPPPTFFLSAILFSPFPRPRWPIWWPDLLAPKILRFFDPGAPWKDLGRDLCSLWLFKTWEWGWGRRSNFLVFCLSLF